MADTLTVGDVKETDRLDVGLCDEDEPGWRGDGGGRGMGCFGLVGVEDGEDGIDCDMVESRLYIGSSAYVIYVFITSDVH